VLKPKYTFKDCQVNLDNTFAYRIDSYLYNYSFDRQYNNNCTILLASKNIRIIFSNIGIFYIDYNIASEGLINYDKPQLSLYF
jgi:hypothetical protein